MATLPPAEIVALSRLLDELSYYQLLELPNGGCSTSELKRAYHGLARRFHPDAYRGQDDAVRAAVNRVAKRLTEAYSVLRDPRRRRAYDERLGAESGGLRIQLAEAEAAAERAVAERTGSTPNGRRYFTLAHGDIDRGDLAAAARNLQMAITFEPGNDFFKLKLEEVRGQL